MLKHFSENKKLSGARWFSRGFGRWVAREERRLCCDSIREVLGSHAAQLGGKALMLDASPVRHQILIARDGAADLAADWSQLPLDSDCLDLLVLVHALEASQDPHAVLREAVRVLRPEGRLLIIGFNRFSLLAFSRTAPWRRQWLSVARIKDWLALLEMQPCGGSYAVFLPPVKAALRRRWRLRWLELAGRRWWPLAGGVFALHTVKKRYGMRLIPPDSFKHPLKNPRLASSYNATLSRGAVTPETDAANNDKITP